MQNEQTALFINPQPLALRPLRFNSSFKTVQAGLQHLVLQTHLDQLLVWGSNLQGQLGLGQQQQKLLRFMPLLGLKISKLACGMNFTLVTTKNGQIFSWGQNKFGQLALNDFFDRFTPTRIRLKEISDIKAGNHHSAFRNSKRLLMAGDNSFGQLTLEHKQYCTPTEVMFESQVQDMHLGWDFSIFQSKGKFYGTGRNDCFQLGLGHKRPVQVPTLIPNISQLKVRSIKCKDSSLLLTEDGKLFAWGQSIFPGLSQPTFIQNQQVSEIEMGIDFAVAATTEDELLVWKSSGNKARMQRIWLGAKGRGQMVCLEKEIVCLFRRKIQTDQILRQHILRWSKEQQRRVTVQALLDQTETQRRKQLEKVLLEIDSLRERFLAIDSQMNEPCATCPQLQSKVAQLLEQTAKIQPLLNQIQGLKWQLHLKEDRVASLEQTIKDFDTQQSIEQSRHKNELQSKAREEQCRLRDQQKQIRRLQEQVQRLSEQVRSGEQQLCQKRRHISMMEQKTQQTKNSLYQNSNLLQENHSLRDQLYGLQQQTLQLQQDLLTLQQQLQSQQTLNNKLEFSLSHLEEAKFQSQLLQDEISMQQIRDQAQQNQNQLLEQLQQQNKAILIMKRFIDNIRKEDARQLLQKKEGLEKGMLELQSMKNRLALCQSDLRNQLDRALSQLALYRQSFSGLQGSVCKLLGKVKELQQVQLKIPQDLTQFKAAKEETMLEVNRLAKQLQALQAKSAKNQLVWDEGRRLIRDLEQRVQRANQRHRQDQQQIHKLKRTVAFMEVTCDLLNK